VTAREFAILTFIGLALVSAGSEAKDTAAEDAMRVYNVDLDGQPITLYLMWGENPHQSWPSHYAQNKHEAEALSAGAFQVRLYMEKNLADWVFCLLEPPRDAHWCLSAAQFIFVYLRWTYTTDIVGGFEKSELGSQDYVFTDSPPQFVLIPGFKQRLEFPNNAVGTTGRASQKVNGVNRIPLWIAFPCGSLNMRGIDEYRMSVDLPDKVLINNRCRESASLPEALQKGGE